MRYLPFVAALLGLPAVAQPPAVTQPTAAPPAVAAPSAPLAAAAVPDPAPKPARSPVPATRSGFLPAPREQTEAFRLTPPSADDLSAPPREGYSPEQD